MSFYYKPTKPSKSDVELATNVLAYCSSELNIKMPKLLFVENTVDEKASILKYESDGAGFADPEVKTIYIVLPTYHYNMIKTIGHECWHIYEGKEGYSSMSEDMANNFGEHIRREMLIKFDKLRDYCGYARV